MSVQVERGVRVDKPSTPWIHKEYWMRRLPTLAADALSTSTVGILGAGRVRQLFNRIAGMDSLSVDERWIPGVGPGRFGAILAPGGCAWALRKHGGCTFCPFQTAVDAYVGQVPLDQRELFALFRAGFNTMRAEVDMVGYFTAGSALNPGEIPYATLRAITEEVARAPRPRWLRIESRVQYMVYEPMHELSRTLAETDKGLDVAIGFETWNDHIRNNLLNKGMTRKAFERAVAHAKRAQVRVTAYVMLKGHWEMSEAFAIEECVRSIDYVFAAGVDEVQLQPLYISPDGSEMERRFRAGTCKPPWLWSIAEVMARTTRHGRPIILGPWENELPKPIAWPKNCARCTPAFMARIQAWRKTLEPGLWDKESWPSCACRKEWGHALGSAC